MWGRRPEPRPVVQCRLCNRTTEETLTQHMEAAHLDEMLEIDVDPESNFAAILGYSEPPK